MSRLSTKKPLADIPPRKVRTMTLPERDGHDRWAMGNWNVIDQMAITRAYGPLPYNPYLHNLTPNAAFDRFLEATLHPDTVRVVRANDGMWFQSFTAFMCRAKVEAAEARKARREAARQAEAQAVSGSEALAA